jgi:murein L,D-transpeptidase YcbB/YkuD
MTRSAGQRRAVALVAVACTLLAACSTTREQEAVRTALRDALTSAKRPAFVSADAEGRKLWKLTQQFYERRAYDTAWIDGNHPRPQMAELITTLGAARDEGLDPELYNVALLEQRRQEAKKGFLSKKGFDPEEAGALDAWLTYLYMKYASDLADGLSDLARADPAWQIKAEKFDPAGRLDEALETNSVARSLTGLTPANPQYVALRKGLAEYRDLAARGGWPAVPRTLKLKAGQRSPHLSALAARLAASNDYSGGAPVAGAAYGGELQAAVKRFQRRHGLADDGIVSPAVVKELNVPIERRIAQIELNLERWRWLPRDLGDRYILVNIPEYRLEVWEGDRVPLAMRVVVGKQDTPTPIFSETMTYLVFSPYWNVPPDIAKGETLPAVLKDPAFLERTNMEVLDTRGQLVDVAALDLSDPTKYRFRQRPGADNSLGLVKFMFPNEHNVYLHDTPADSLFARASRSFSHGCVRVERPDALASYVLGDQPEWTKQKIADAMQAHQEQVVKLRKGIPVYLGYWTARVAADGAMQFRKDVYGIDQRQTVLLGERLQRLRTTAAAAAMAANGKATPARLNVSSTD